MLDSKEIIHQIPDNHIKDYLVMAINKLEKLNSGSSHKLLETIKCISDYHNYITEEEYDEIKSTLVNQHGIVNNFDHKELEKYLLGQLKPVEDKPYYNKYVLFIVMNYLWSKHTKFIEDIASTGRYSKQVICYILATDMLKSESKGWVRDMFNL